MSKVIAVCCSDIHIENQPPWRSAEPDWFAAMARSLTELKEVAKGFDVPVIFAGDVCTRWYASPELINFAIKHLPVMYSIPGNHDLPDHRIEAIERSAYWTLVGAGRLINLTGPTFVNDTLILHPFPWGTEIIPKEPDRWIDGLGAIHLAVVHKYIWKEGYGHVGADENQRASKYRESLRGYDAAIFGDNHKGFLIGTPGKQMVMNCGTFFRRHSDELSYKPHIGLLHDDGSIVPYFLDISKDLYVEDYTPSGAKKDRPNHSTVLDGFRGLGKDSLDFCAAIHRNIDQDPPDEPVEKLMLQSIEKQ